MPDEGELSQNYWLRIHQIQAGMWVTQTRDLTKHDCRDAGGRAPKVGALGDAGAVAEGQGETGNRSRGQPGLCFGRDYMDVSTACLWWCHPQRRGRLPPNSTEARFFALNGGFFKLTANRSPRHRYLFPGTRYKHIHVFALVADAAQAGLSTDSRSHLLLSAQGPRRKVPVSRLKLWDSV
jgi:hypothetical protein